MRFIVCMCRTNRRAFICQLHRKFKLKIQFIKTGQDVDLRLDRQLDPRVARLDQDLRGSPQTQPTPVSAPSVIPATTDPRAANAFNIADK